MKTRLLLSIIGISLFTALSVNAQKKTKDTDRGYAFEGRNLVIGIGSGFIGYSYGYGKLGGAPLMLSVEYGIHRYFGAGIYGGLLDRNPQIGEKVYDMTVYTFGLRGQLHAYNILDDLVKTNLRGDVLDIYGIVYIGMDHFETNMKLPNKRTWYISGGLGVRAYPFKKARGLGFFTEFSPVLMPWQLGLNYCF